MKPNSLTFLNAVTNTGTQVSSAIDAQFLVSGSIQAKFSDATAGGSLKIQASNDIVAGNAAPVNWSDVATASVSSGALTLLSQAVLNYRWIRVSWVSSAGAGTVTVNGFFQGQ